jgi:hypothetical protein
VTAKKARKELERLLEDFQRRDDYGDLWTRAARVRIESKELPVPGLLFFLLTRIMGLRNLGPEEKRRDRRRPCASQRHPVVAAL